MSLIKVSGLTFAYAGSYDHIFENVSFRIDTDWKLGFTGRNGRGKTTFLRLLQGGYEYGGSISASVDFSYFPYTVSDPGQTTAEVIGGIYPAYSEWELLRELSLLEVEEEILRRPFSALSNGEQTKILLAVLFLKENNFLLIDEPTNHLDMHGRKTVSRYLNKKKGFILVSHDRAFLDGCIDHVLSINKTNIEIQKGSFSSWLVNKERRDNYERGENERLQKDIFRLAAAARRTGDWSDRVEKTKFGTLLSGIKPDKGYIGHKSAKMMKRARVVEARRRDALDEKAKLLKNIENADALKVVQLPWHSKQLVSLDDVSLYYGEKAACEHVSFTVEQGDRVALCGRNGSGKSSVIKLIRGEEIAWHGNFRMGTNLCVSYVSQDTSGLRGDLSSFARENGVEESLFKAMLRKLDFSRIQFEKDIADFSGGQKKKVLIAKSMAERANLLIWDEPLNFIDVISRMQIEDLLFACKPTILFVEHDSVFCEHIATKQVNL